ncbi:MAG: GNAT family N-acetyltransferase [Burkholderiaceae bacterium]
MTSALECRLAKTDDVLAIHAIQEGCYRVSMQEQIDVIVQRLQAAPDTCWIAEDKAGACGYLFAYPSNLGTVTALGGRFAVVSNADTLYLHDLAVSARMAGKGIGNALVELAMHTARRMEMRYSALVSVQDSRQYWMRRGYEDGTPTARYADHLSAYPDKAVYMIKRLLGSR